MNMKTQVSNTGELVHAEPRTIWRLLGALLDSWAPLLLCAAICFSSGCAGVGPFLSKSSTLPEGRSVVFGKIHVKSGFDAPRYVPLFFRRYTKLKVTGPSLSTGELYEDINAADTFFCWSLPPGQYRIEAVEITRIVSESDATVNVYGIDGGFSVPAAGKVIYLGDLDISLTATGSIMSINDNYEAALSDLHLAYPKVQGELTRSFLKLPSAAPGHWFRRF